MITEGTDEAKEAERRQTLQELVNAAPNNTRRKPKGGARLGRLPWASLPPCAADADSKDTEANGVTLMTLHASKGGLEFPVVCSWAWSRVLFPQLPLPGGSLRPGGRSGASCYVGYNPRQGAAVPSPRQRKAALGRHARVGGRSRVSLELPPS